MKPTPTKPTPTKPTPTKPTPMRSAPVTCPFCDSPDVEVVSPWGGQLITRQLRCRGCNTHFEALRPEFDAPEEGSSTSS